MWAQGHRGCVVGKQSDGGQVPRDALGSCSQAAPSPTCGRLVSATEWPCERDKRRTDAQYLLGEGRFRTHRDGS